jgi:hypothetical protein
VAEEFTIKDSGERSEFEGGMVRDSAGGKLDYTSLLFGPMLDRYIAHLTKGREKYPDPEPGVPNWTLAQGEAELQHAKQSLLRHVFQFLRGERDEDHAAAVWFNVNLIEYIRHRQMTDAWEGPQACGCPDCVRLRASKQAERAADLEQLKAEWVPPGIEVADYLRGKGVDHIGSP